MSAVILLLGFSGPSMGMSQCEGINHQTIETEVMLDYVALGILIAVVVIIFYGIIAIHDIPYEISKHRGHPHQDAIHVAGWVSLFTLHVLWPFLWIWATLYRKDRGWGFVSADGEPESEEEAVLELQHQLEELRQEVAELKAACQPEEKKTEDAC